MDFIEGLARNPGRTWSFEQFCPAATSEFGLDNPGPPSSKMRKLRITAIRRLRDYFRRIRIRERGEELEVWESCVNLLRPPNCSSAQGLLIDRMVDDMRSGYFGQSRDGQECGQEADAEEGGRKENVEEDERGEQRECGKEEEEEHDDGQEGSGDEGETIGFADGASGSQRIVIGDDRDQDQERD